MDKSSTNNEKGVEAYDVTVQAIESIVLSSLYDAYRMGISRLTFSDLKEIIFTGLGNDITFDIQRINMLIRDTMFSLAKQDHIMTPDNGKNYRITLFGIEELEKKEYKNMP